MFGRRQTVWDAIITVLGGQERNAMGLLLKVLFSALVNFTLGMLSSIFVFTFKLPWLLADYKPGLVSVCSQTWHSQVALLLPCGIELHSQRICKFWISNMNEVRVDCCCLMA